MLQDDWVDLPRSRINTSHFRQAPASVGIFYCMYIYIYIYRFIYYAFGNFLELFVWQLLPPGTHKNNGPSAAGSGVGKVASCVRVHRTGSGSAE